MLRIIKISELEPGMLVTRVVEQNGPVKIRRVGFIKSEAMVKGLTEMGVSSLEIDDAQTISLEPEHGDDAYTDTGTVRTPTQQLMAEAKQNAATDKALSQNFHRSLFMPSVDEMPSKWRLHIRPYAFLTGSIFIGFVVGYLLISLILKAPSFFSDSQQVQSQPQNMVEPPSQIVSPETSLDDNASDVTAAPALGTQPANVETSNADLQSISKLSEEGAAALTSTVNQAQPQISQAQNQNGQDSERVEQPDSESTQENTDQAPMSQDTESDVLESASRTVNGIELNEGETVLGYQGTDISTELDSDGSNVSMELLSRVNQVAAQIEAEQNTNDTDTQTQQTEDLPTKPLDLTRLLGEPSRPDGPVIDLRQRPAQDGAVSGNEGEGATSEPMVTRRIDQLPPAILTQMPAMSFSAHMYASNPRDRWVRVNGQRLLEGDIIAENLTIIEIQSEKVVLSFKDEQFTMNALSDW